MGQYCSPDPDALVILNNTYLYFLQIAVGNGNSGSTN